MNSDELNSSWQRVCDQIKNYPTINASQMNAFFSRLVPQAMSEDFLMLTADNDFIKSWIERHYAQSITSALKDIYGVDFTVVVEVDPNQVAPAASAPSAAQSAPAPQPAQAASPSPVALDVEEESPTEITRQSDPEEEPPAKEGEKSYSGESNSPTSTLTFENFVIGASNRMAYSMAVSVAEDPGSQKILNPLFIYGKSGLGKTHLMRSIQNYINETRKDMRTLYVDSADFLSEYVETVVAHDKDKGSFRTFKNKYQEADVLLIDDIQQFQGKEQTLDIVFQIFNKLVDEGKQVVLSADRAPKNITMDERYQTRFNSGGTVDIQPPEVETKMGIIKSFVDEYRSTGGNPDFAISEDIQRYIAENSSSNIRELKSAVTKVIYHVNCFPNEELTLSDVTSLLENHFSGGTMKKLTISDIQKQVELYYDIPHSELIGQKRPRKIVYARQIAIYLTRQMLDLPYNYIGKNFGDRDHTTIMY